METWPLIRKQTGRGNRPWLFILSLRASLRGKVWRAFPDFWGRPHWFYPTQLNKIQPEPSPTKPNQPQLNSTPRLFNTSTGLFCHLPGYFPSAKWTVTTCGNPWKRPWVLKMWIQNTNECMTSASWWWGKSCSKLKKRRYTPKSVDLRFETDGA